MSRVKHSTTPPILIRWLLSLRSAINGDGAPCLAESIQGKTNINNPLSASHIYMKYPERFIQYGNQLYFDPGLPENRSFICEVVRDIVSRYDVDAIHMDDYFYPPYPIAGTPPFPDEKKASITMQHHRDFLPDSLPIGEETM